MAVKPLTRRTMTLSELQLRTANFLRLVKFQLRRMPHQDGLNDEEFIAQQVEPFETDIYQDRQILKMARKAKRGERK
jgi:hypothetical protein